MTYYVAANSLKPTSPVHKNRQCRGLEKAFDIQVLPARKAKRRRRCRYCFPEEDQALDRD